VVYEVSTLRSYATPKNKRHELVSKVHSESSTQVHTSKSVTLFFFYENKCASTLKRQVRGCHLKGNVKFKFERPHTLRLSVLQVSGAASLGD